MITLEGKNLCERQKNLNFKVSEAAKNKVDLHSINPEGNSDIDRIFKIDLASKYRDAEYIVEQLKSGDSLYVSRALRCEWLYDSEHAHIINPDYLHHHVFPMMSSQMKKKTLSAISNYVRDETRAQIFCEYCLNTNMIIQACKFLVFTSESFKEEFMNDAEKFNKLHHEMDRAKYYENLIGSSFNLADIYGEKTGLIKKLSYLYAVNEEKYLDLLEKHTKVSYYVHMESIGRKLSRSMLKKHKDRILKNPLLYLSILDKKELVSYSTSEDALVYIKALLPDDASMFWKMNFYSLYSYIFQIFKLEESMYKFVKNLFRNKYPESNFETSGWFHCLKYYDLMTSEERETWAISQLENKTGVFPESEEYRWYEFISFNRAFAEVKKKILITTDQYNRSEMLRVLVKSAKTQKDVQELLDYYYKRHVNESKNRKELFLRGIIHHHNVFEFEESCWDALHKIFHSVELYTSSSRSNSDFLVASLIYHIINDKPIPKALVIENITCYTLRQYLDKLSEGKQEAVYKFLFQFTVNKITEFDTREYNDQVKDEVRQYLYSLQAYMKMFGKKENFPEIAIKYMKSDLKHFEQIFEEPGSKEIEITEGYLLRCLKKDASQILEKLPQIKKKCDNSHQFRINMVLKKLKIYFSRDIAKKYLDFLLQTLDNNNETTALVATVFAIFVLGDEKLKWDIMDKYAPTSPKIAHNTIERHHLHMQEAICRMHCYSRPPVPLAKSAIYITGDYVHKCDEMFNMYLATLTPDMRMEFIQLLLDAPLSVQKRGLRLAFQTYESADLKNLVSNVWKKTKNVSLRSILYKQLLEKVVKEKGNTQEELFKVLQQFTTTIHEDDDCAIFDCFKGCKLPENLRGLYLQTVWTTVAALPSEKSATIDHKTTVMKSLASNFTLIDEDYLMPIITNQVQEMLSKEKLCPELNSSIAEMNNAKWQIVAQYIISAANPNEGKLGKCLNILKSIVDPCFNQWNVHHGSGVYVFQSFFKGFMNTLDNFSSYFEAQDLRAVNAYLLDRLEANFDISEVYSYLWYFKLAILTRTVVNGRCQLDKTVYVYFGLQLGKLVTELKDSNRFYTYLIPKILETISFFIRTITYLKENGLTVDDIPVLIAHGLSQRASSETLVLALEIIPLDLSTCPAAETELPQIFKKIKEHNNKELLAFMNEKFIYSDYKVRKFLQCK